MAETSNTSMEEMPAKETIETPIDDTSSKMEQSEDDLSTDVTMEPANENEQSDSGADKTIDGKKKYTEEERLKRKEFFKQVREKKRLAREKYLEKFVKKFPPRGTSDGIIEMLPKGSSQSISYEMTDEENKMLGFYRVRLSTLRSENEELHKRLAYLVRENMRLLQSGTPTTVI